MIVLIQTIAGYILFSLTIVFLLWLSLIGMIYQNNRCYSTEIQKSIYQSRNISSVIDSRLKLNHFTVLGTHNSYHQSNLIYKYDHPNLGTQLSFGIRQLELDIHLMADHNVIYHLQFFDDKTNCFCFNDCLMKIVKWTDSNPSHYPIYLFIEIKQMFYEDLLTGLHGGVKCHHFQQLKDELLEVFSSDTFILPQQIQGDQTSIKTALKQQRTDELSSDYTYKNFGWPPLYQSLGKIIPIFIDDVYNIVVDLYSNCDPFQNFFFVAQSNLDLSYSSIISVSNSIKDDQILLNSAMNGQIIRILLGYGSNDLEKIYQRTKQYGIHIISSDSVQCSDTLFCQALATDFASSTILCNIYSAPIFCNSSISFV